LADDTTDIFSGLPFKSLSGLLSDKEKETEFRAYIRGLKTAEKGGDDQQMLDVDPPAHLKAAADGHGEGVHGQPNAGQKNLNKSHKKPFYVC
jgi:hypothetical protein